MADFNYKKIKNELISLGVLSIYCILEMFVLTKNSKGDPLELDPFYLLSGNEIQEIIGISNYGLYIFLYVLFMLIYFGAFYILSIKKVK